MDEAQVERRAEERGEMKTDIKYIKDAVKSLVDHNKNQNLKCNENTEILHKLDRKYKSDEQIKQHFIKSLITQAFKASAIVTATATAVYAMLKN